MSAFGLEWVASAVILIVAAFVRFWPIRPIRPRFEQAKFAPRPPPNYAEPGPRCSCPSPQHHLRSQLATADMWLSVALGGGPFKQDLSGYRH